ncbi:MAG: type II toxin-antitoxin system RelE/ParE family toxin [Proteobacteria bacterium]|nr:type II toxin-antitoxin system RelE/ParE family toxin [Pseudomonadota bacterium]
MIKTYANRETQRIAEVGKTRSFPQNIVNRAIIRLTMIDVAENINDLINPPSNRLEKLHGDRVGRYSIRINNQYRICFKFENSNAYDVEIIDYH